MNGDNLPQQSFPVKKSTRASLDNFWKKFISTVYCCIGMMEHKKDSSHLVSHHKYILPFRNLLYAVVLADFSDITCHTWQMVAGVRPDRRFSLPPKWTEHWMFGTSCTNKMIQFSVYRSTKITFVVAEFVTTATHNNLIPIQIYSVVLWLSYSLTIVVMLQEHVENISIHLVFLMKSFCTIPWKKVFL